MQDLLHTLTTLHPKLIDLSLDRMMMVLERLGNPHQKIPPVVHVAGTNGKGSTIAFLRALLEAAGLRVHVYTSPHLVDFNERIVLGGCAAAPRGPIPDHLLQPLLEQARDAAGDTPITFFEVTTIAAFLAFARYDADIVILETGMGGRLDATNVIERPLLTAITAIGFDHMSFLGQTLPQIAGEKAGIIKTGVPCLIGVQSTPDMVMPVFTARAQACNAPLLAQGVDWQSWPTTTGMGYQDGAEAWPLPAPSLKGRHQIDNAGLALGLANKVLTALNRPFTPAIAASGVQNAIWPGRMQPIDIRPICPDFPDHWACWLDGGHNEDGARIIAAQARQWQDEDGRPLDLVLGMLTTKQPEHFLRPLLPFIDRLVTIPIPNDPLGWNPIDLATYGTALGLDTTHANTIAMGFQHLRTAPTPGPRRVLICGSLHLAGVILGMVR